jgi:SnoaL-like domain
MPASTPVRAATAVAVLVAVTAGCWWWRNPERQIHRLLSDVASALTREGTETDLRALAAVASLQSRLAPDVSLDMGGGATPLRGRQKLISLAARARATNPMMRVQFFDAEIDLSGDSSGTTRVTVQITTRTATGEEVAAAHVVSIALVRAEGRWRVTSARVLPRRDTAL